jgi:phytoene dehydrogenase-like protein
VIERLISSDLIRGLVFTDAKIGVSTFPHDASLLQNRVFLYHIIGRGSGEWLVPVGGMGAVVDELVRVARETGKVTIATGARVRGIDPGKSRSSVAFEIDGERRGVDSRFVLCNASAEILAELTGERDSPQAGVEGSVFKVNMLLERLPRLRSSCCHPEEAFAGTFHIDEGYDQMLASYRESVAGAVPAKPPGEVYCHTLTDDSILSEALNRRSFHSLTLFGLDMPYALFENANARTRSEVLGKYLAGINQFLDEPIESCLAKDGNGAPCIEAKTPVDLENEIHLPRGNIFHGDLTWPFTDIDGDAGQWGVETAHANIFLCGSAAKRGGAVSGIPGHNAAMKVLEWTSGAE